MTKVKPAKTEVEFQILSITVMCPQGDAVHVAFWDRVTILWKKKQIWFDCPVCEETHIAQF